MYGVKKREQDEKSVTAYSCGGLGGDGKKSRKN